jgi:ribosomal protein S18 acetylase RimI-like enzyme
VTVEPSPIVREAQTADIPALVSLMADFYAESNYRLDPDWARASFHRLLAGNDRGSAWIAFCGDAAAGYVVLTTRHSMEFGGPDGFIDDLFVRPAFRRAGIATTLLERLFDDCRQRGMLALHVEVGAENSAAQALYERFGLSSDGRQHLTARLKAGV